MLLLKVVIVIVFAFVFVFVFVFCIWYGRLGGLSKAASLVTSHYGLIMDSPPLHYNFDIIIGKTIVETIVVIIIILGPCPNNEPSCYTVEE